MSRNKRHWLGQHFLKSPQIIEHIVATVREQARTLNVQNVLEIGPGQGALTYPLLTALPLHSLEWMWIERDTYLANQLAEHVPPQRVVEGDFLNVPAARWLPAGGAPLGVVSNLPYSAATAIVLELCNHPRQIAFMVLMFQKEVALRLRAEPNSPDRGSLSLWVQNEWEVEPLIDAPPSAFSPPPKVDSEVVLMRPRVHPRIEGSTETPELRSRWQKLLKLAFSQRRQMLRRIFRIPNDPRYSGLLEASEIDGTRRAQSLDFEEWNRLWHAFRRLALGALVATTLSHLSPLPAAHANLRETFGMGSGLTALTASGPSAALAAELNPALLPSRPPGIQLSYSVLAIKPWMVPIQNIVTSNSVIADASPSSTGNVDTDLAPTVGQMVGLTWSPFPEAGHRLTFGLSTYAPFSQAGTVDTGEAYLPEFVLLRARTQRPEVSLAAGFALSPRVHVGAGLRLGFAVASRVSAFIKSQSSGNPSSMRLSSSVAPFWVPFAGMSLRLGAIETGLVARAPSSSSLSFTLSSSAQVIGDLTGLALSLSGASNLLYDPPSFEWGTKVPVSENLHARVQLEYQIWRAFRPPTVTVSNATTGGGIVVASSQSPALSLQNVVSPKASLEWTLGDWVTEWSYTYRPSIFSALPTGNQNQLDPPRHRFFAALMRPFGRIWVQIHTQWIHLIPQTVVKSGTDEIGAPGYTAGGWLGGGGLSVQLGL